MLVDNLKVLSLLCHYITGMFKRLFLRVIMNPPVLHVCTGCRPGLDPFKKQVSEKPLEIIIFVDVFDILKILQVNENGVVLQKEL